MTISSLTYMPPIRKDAVARELDYELLDSATAKHAAGDHRGAVEEVFRHLFPGDPPDLSAPFSFTQGSSRVSVRMDDGVCFVSVPLVRLPAGGGGIAALRYLLSRVNSSGQLHQARLRDDDVHLEFSDKLSAMHPQKLIEVLRRMAMCADQHDDWMISQFGVTPLERGHIEPLGDAELAAADQLWKQHWDEVDELLKEAQRKRSIWFLNEVTSFAHQRIRFALPLAGSVLPRLLESVNTFNDTDVDPQKRETTLARCARDMKALTAEELHGALGHVEYAISPHGDGTPAKLASYIGPGHYLETIERYRASGSAIDAALAMIGTYYYLLQTHSWPAEVATALKAGLAATSDVPWREAATLLVTHAHALIQQYSDDGEEAQS